MLTCWAALGGGGEQAALTKGMVVAWARTRWRQTAGNPGQAQHCVLASSALAATLLRHLQKL